MRDLPNDIVIAQAFEAKEGTNPARRWIVDSSSRMRSVSHVR
jgi:hypothetical protein